MSDKKLRKDIKPIYLKLKPELRAQLDEYCVKTGRTRTLVVEKIIEKALETKLLDQIDNWQRD